MDALALAQAIFDSNWVRVICAFILANVISSVMVAIFSSKETFYLGELGNFLYRRVLPFLLGWATVKVVALVAFGEYAALVAATEAIVSSFVIMTLLGKIFDNLRVVFPGIPEWAGSKPKPETESSV